MARWDTGTEAEQRQEFEKLGHSINTWYTFETWSAEPRDKRHAIRQNLKANQKTQEMIRKYGNFEMPR